MLYDRVRYILKYDGISKEVQEPKGWDGAKISWLRSKQYHGIDITVSTPLQYYGDAKDIILELYENYGINAVAYLEIWKKNDYTDVLELDMIGSLDFKTLEIKDSVSIKFNANETVAKFKKESNTEIEYDRIYRLDGTSREHQDEFHDVQYDGIDSTTTSVLMMKNHTPREYVMSYDAGKAWRGHALGLKLRNGGGTCESFSHDDANETDDGDASWTDHPLREGLPRCFWSDSEENVRLNITIDTTMKMYIQFEGKVENRVYELICVVYNSNYEEKRIARTLFKITNFGSGLLQFSRSDSFSVDINKGESLSIEHRFGGNFGNIWKRGRYKINFAGYTSTANLTITTDTTLKPSVNKAIKVADLFNSISDVCFNSSFESDYLKNGLFKDLMITNGFMLRGFLDKENGYIPPSISFKKLFESLNVINPIGVEVGKGVISLYEINHFYGDCVYKDLGTVKDFILRVDNNFLFSQVKVGFKKYEKQEDGGSLVEFNAETEYTTSLLGTGTKLQLLSDVRGDSTGIEKAREGYFLETDEDLPDECKDDKTKSSKSDNDLWFVDVIYDTKDNIYKTAKWKEHFSTMPGGIPNGDTYFNYRFTPRNIIDRHISYIRQGYTNIRDMRLIYSSTKSLKSLVTYPKGKPAFYEDGNVNMNLEEPLTLGLIAEFETKYSFKDLNGYTDGKRNYYCMLKFNYKGVGYLGYINKVNIEDSKTKVECIIKVIIR